MRTAKFILLCTLLATGCKDPLGVDVVSPDGFRQNLPPGFTVISDYGMDDSPPPTNQYYEGEPMGDWRAQYWGTAGGTMRRISDPTAPLSPDNVLEEVYPPGLSGNGATSWARDIPQSDQVYISWVVKWDADFEQNGTSDKQIWFNLGSAYNDTFMFQFHWGREAMWNIAPAVELIPGQGSLYANLSPLGINPLDNLPLAPLVTGEWIEYEFLFDYTTGTVRWWRNGVEHAHHTGRTFSRIWKITMDTTWGGGGNKQGTHSRYTDHITVAVN